MRVYQLPFSFDFDSSLNVLWTYLHSHWYLLMLVTLYVSAQRRDFGKCLPKGSGIGGLSIGMRADHLCPVISIQIIMEWEPNAISVV